MILGEVGIGKTITLYQLAQSLICIARKADPDRQIIPVVFNLSSWKRGTSIFDWLIERIKQDYNIDDTKIVDSLLKEGRIIPFLDQLDEIDPRFQSECCESINKFLKSSYRLVVCCRLNTYDAYEDSDKLCLNGAICLKQLTNAQLENYFEVIETNSSSDNYHINYLKAFGEIQKQPKLLDIIRIPIFLNCLIFLISRGQELLYLHHVQNLKEGKDIIIEKYVEMRLKDYKEYIFSNQQRVKQNKIKKIEICLKWLSKKMQENYKAEFLVEELQPTWLLTKEQKIIYKIGVALFFGSVFGLVGFQIGEPGFKFISALATGLTFGAGIGMSSGISGERIELIQTPPAFLSVILSGLLAGIAAWSLFPKNLLTILGSITLGIIIGLLIFSKILKTKYNIPNQGIFRSFISMLIYILCFGVIGGLLTSSVCILSGGQDVLYFFWLGAISFGLIVGLPNGGNTCIMHLVLRLVLWKSGLAPWDLNQFLHECSSSYLSLLQRSGNRYSFAHSLLRDHFAKKDFKSLV